MFWSYYFSKQNTLLSLLIMQRCTGEAEGEKCLVIILTWLSQRENVEWEILKNEKPFSPVVRMSQGDTKQSSSICFRFVKLRWYNHDPVILSFPSSKPNMASEWSMWRWRWMTPSSTQPMPPRRSWRSPGRKRSQCRVRWMGSMLSGWWSSPCALV